MPIVDTVRSEMTAAMKAGDARRRDIMRLLLSALGNARIELRHDLSDEEAVTALQREAKQRRDSIEEYAKGDRQDLVQVEQEELDVIAGFLPQPLSEQEISALARTVIAEVEASGPGDLGKVMRPLMERAAGRADGRRLSEIVRELLTAP